MMIVYLVALFATITPWQPDVESFWLDAVLHLGVFVPFFAIIALVVVASIQNHRLQALGPPNIQAVALSTWAPTEPIILRRPASWLAIGAAHIAVPFAFAVPPMMSALGDVESSSDDPAGRLVGAGTFAAFGLLLTTSLIIVVAMMILGIGPAGRPTIGKLDADGIQIHRLKLTVPWQDVRMVSAKGPNGVAGLGFWLTDPAKTIASSSLRPWLRRIMLYGPERIGWLNLPRIQLRESAQVAVAAIALHRAYLRQQAAGTRQVPAA